MSAQLLFTVSSNEGRTNNRKKTTQWVAKENLWLEFSGASIYVYDFSRDALEKSNENGGIEFINQDGAAGVLYRPAETE